MHAAGGLVYGDGANLNAILGVVKPADVGFDCLHINIHKTFSTPHGCGGPGAGPVVVNARLEPFLPVAGRRAPRDGQLRARLRSTREHRATEGLPRPLRHSGPRATRTSACTAPTGCARSARRPCSTRITCACCSRTLYDLAYDRARACTSSCSRAAARSQPRRQDAGHRQALDRLRHPSADHLLPADRRRGDHDRADRGRVAGPRWTTSSR